MNEHEIFKTDKPAKKKRVLSEKQKEALRKGREKRQAKLKAKLEKEAEKDHKQQTKESRKNKKVLIKEQEKVKKQQQKNDEVNKQEQINEFKQKFKTAKMDLLEQIDDPATFKTVRKYVNSFKIDNNDSVEQIKKQITADLTKINNYINNKNNE